MTASAEQPPVHIVGLGGTLRPHSTSLFALEIALQAAAEAGATTELLNLARLNLPFYRPGDTLSDYGPDVARLVEAARRADGMIWSTAAYHGTLSGVMKNALDFLQFLKGDGAPYLERKVVGLIATAGGGMAAVNTVNALIHTVHALRGTVASLHVAIPQAYQAIRPRQREIEPQWRDRLEALGRLVVHTTDAWRRPAAPEPDA